MIGMVTDRKFRNMMMWFVCVISLVLCLHFNTHNAETAYQEHAAYETELVHSHDVHQKQSHIHHDNFHEHFSEYPSSQQIGLLFILLHILMIDWVKAYLYLMVSRIFKPPRKTISFKFLFNFGV